MPINPSRVVEIDKHVRSVCSQPTYGKHRQADVITELIVKLFRSLFDGTIGCRSVNDDDKRKSILHKACCSSFMNGKVFRWYLRK